MDPENLPDPQYISNQYLLQEVRLNRKAIKEVGDAVNAVDSKKVSRAELVAWLIPAVSVIIAVVLGGGG